MSSCVNYYCVDVGDDDDDIMVVKMKWMCVSVFGFGLIFIIKKIKFFLFHILIVVFWRNKQNSEISTLSCLPCNHHHRQHSWPVRFIHSFIIDLTFLSIFHSTNVSQKKNSHTGRHILSNSILCLIFEI